MSRQSRKRKRNRAEQQREVNKMQHKEDNKMENSTATYTEVRTLAVGMLEVDPKYQRFHDQAWSSKIGRTFNSDLLDTLHVSFRDGHYYIFDGQHRYYGVLKRFKDNGYPVTCKIYHGLSEEEEARLFVLFNISRKKMPAASLLKAQVAGGDEEAISFLEHTRGAGFVIDPAKRVTCKCGIQAVDKAQKCYQTLGPDNYDRMLKLLMATWGGERWTITQNMLGGMCMFIKIFGGKIEDQLFIKQLKVVDETKLLKQAGNYYGMSKSVAYAAAIADFYNYRLRGAKKLKRSMLLAD